MHRDLLALRQRNEEATTDELRRSSRLLNQAGVCAVQIGQYTNELEAEVVALRGRASPSTPVAVAAVAVVVQTPVRTPVEPACRGCGGDRVNLDFCEQCHSHPWATAMAAPAPAFADPVLIHNTHV